jgi:hypothetical protein
VPQEREALFPHWIHTFEGNSEASTSAGPSPSLEDASSPFFSESLSPPLQRPSTPSSDEDGKLEMHASPQLTRKRRGLVEKGMAQQTRKIFVGGVPQSIDQNDLYKMFGKFGKVKKAWLQMFHPDRAEGMCNKHRGFGFVIFAQEVAVEEILGEDFSKIVYIGEGIRLEVKRAIGKTNTCSKPFDVNEGAIQVPTQPSCEQSMPNLSFQAILTALPPVPPFPVIQQTQLHWQCCSIGDVTMLSSQALPPVTASPPDWLEQFLPQVLCDAFAGQRPRNKQDLERLLRQAVPDYYAE